MQLLTNTHNNHYHWYRPPFEVLQQNAGGVSTKCAAAAERTVRRDNNDVIKGLGKGQTPSLALISRAVHAGLMRFTEDPLDDLAPVRATRRSLMRQHTAVRQCQ